MFSLAPLRPYGDRRGHHRHVRVQARAIRLISRRLRPSHRCGTRPPTTRDPDAPPSFLCSHRAVIASVALLPMRPLSCVFVRVSRLFPEKAHYHGPATPRTPRPGIYELPTAHPANNIRVGRGAAGQQSKQQEPRRRAAERQINRARTHSSAYKHGRAPGNAHRLRRACSPPPHQPAPFRRQRKCDARFRSTTRHATNAALRTVEGPALSHTAR